MHAKHGFVSRLRRVQLLTAGILRRFFVSPRGLAILYIAAIPAFALIYAFGMPREFYHATAAREPEGWYVIDAARSQLESVQKAWLGALPKDMRVSGASITSLDPTQNGGFDCVVHFHIGKNQQYASAKLSVRVVERHMRVLDGQTTYQTALPFELRDLPDAITAELRRWHRDDRGPFTDWEVGDSPGAVIRGGMKVPSGVAERLLDAWKIAALGRPSETGRFQRYLYFSAVTITTVGFGDVVPLTNRARLTVAAESVYGIVVIGMFLNALARRAGERASSRAPDPGSNRDASEER